MRRMVDGIMFGKFNNRDKRGCITVANKKGVSIIDKPFKDVSAEVRNKSIEEHRTEKAPYDPMDKLFIWEAAFDKKRRGL